MANKLELLKRGELAIISIQNPPHNTLSAQVLAEFPAILEMVKNDASVRVVIITGRGLFSAGADVKDIWGIAKRGDMKEALELLAGANAVVDAVENLGKPTLAVIDGLCLGGGNELAMVCTARIATEDSRFGQPEISLGIMPGMGGTQRLPRLIELESALRLILSGTVITAKEALELGLVDRVVLKKDILSEAKKFSQDILSNPIQRTAKIFNLKHLQAILSQDIFQNLIKSKSADATWSVVEAVTRGMALSLPEALKLEQEFFAELAMKDSAKRGLAKFLKIELPKTDTEQKKSVDTYKSEYAETPPWEKEEYIMLRNTLREFAEKDIKPRVAWMEEHEEVPRDILKKMGDLGFYGISFPESYGGFGLGKIGVCIFADEITYVHPSTAVVAAAHSSLACDAIYLFGTEDQKQRYLVPGISGDKIGALVTTEPGVGSDVGGMKTMAKKVDGGWILNGAKQWVTSGEIADFIVVFAQTDPLGGNKTLGAFIVDSDAELRSKMKREKKMGIHASRTNSFPLNDIFVSDQNVLGEVGQGFKMVMQVFNRSRIAVAAGCIGFIRRAIDEAIKFSKDRILFGEPMYMKQNTQLKLAEMESSRMLVEAAIYEFAWRADRGLDVRNEAATVKYWAAELAKKAVDTSLQLHGGAGFIKDYPISGLYDDVRIFPLFEGTSEVQLLTIAKEMIKSRIL